MPVPGYGTGTNFLGPPTLPYPVGYAAAGANVVGNGRWVATGVGRILEPCNPGTEEHGSFV